jgi:hypothetical protein
MFFTLCIAVDRVSHVYVIAEDNDSALAVSSYNATTVDPVRRRVEVSVAPSVMSDQLAEDNLAAGFSMKIMAQKFLVRKECRPPRFFKASSTQNNVLRSESQCNLIAHASKRVAVARRVSKCFFCNGIAP